MADYAWVTLATNDTYCLGGLVLAHSLKRVVTKHNLVILVTPNVTTVMKERLQTVFNEVITVDVLDSKDAAHLALLARPELGITFTKLHCWTLTQYKKCVFLDADTLVFQNCDELFEREELSAAPDVGWPDCFNSGVFVYQPSKETFDALLKFAQEKGSFDGGDQGLLNQFFSGWARDDIKKHLPFVYNVCTTAFYSYLPALKQYGRDMKIMHFIGSLKPWLQRFNWFTRTVVEEGHLQAPLQYWWDLFLENVHPCLDASMARWECGVTSKARYEPPQDESSPFPWHHTPIHDPISENVSSLLHPSTETYDPWENYPPPPVTTPTLPPTNDNDVEYPKDNTEYIDDAAKYEEIKHVLELPKPWYENEINEKNEEMEIWHDTESNFECQPGGSHCGTVTESYHLETIHFDEHVCEPNVDKNFIYEHNSCVCDIDNDALVCSENVSIIEDVRPRHPYDNYYLIHRTILDNKGYKRCAHEELPPDPTPPPSPTEDMEIDTQAGIAGTLSQLTLGSEQGPAIDEHLRRQGWETGNIDYMGADAFSNIWAKISQTLSSPPAQAPMSPELAVPGTPPTPTSTPVPPSSEPTPEPVKPTPESTVPAVEAVAPTPESTKPVAPAPEPVTPVPETVAPAPEPVAPIPKQDAPVTESVAPPTLAPAPVVPSAPEIPTPTEVKADTVGSEIPVTVGKVEAPIVSKPPAQATATKDSKDAIEEKQDSKQAQIEADKNLASPPKPIEKLVCHLTPTGGIEPLVTPECEIEDAATIAQSIIAKEEALSSPTVTSATPTATTPIHPAIPQNLKDLCVDVSIPETPPVPQPVSLAQIGIIPSVESKKLETAKPEISKPKEEPVIVPKTAEEKPVVVSKIPEEKPAIAPKAPEEKPARAPKTPEEKPVVVSKPPEEKPVAVPKTPEAEKPETVPVKPIKKSEKKVKSSKSVEEKSEESPKVVESKPVESPKAKEVEIPKTPETKAQIEKEPELKRQTSSEKPKETITKKATKTKEEPKKLSEPPKTEEKPVAEPEKKEKAQKIKEKTKSVEESQVKEEKSQPAQEELKAAPQKKEESASVETKESVQPPPKPKKVLKKAQPLPAESIVAKSTQEMEAPPTPPASKPPTQSEKPKEPEKPEPPKETPEPPKPKKVVKPLTTPKQKEEATEIAETPTGAESSKKSDDKPVAPPRKKEKKPTKDKK